MSSSTLVSHSWNLVRPQLENILTRINHILPDQINTIIEYIQPHPCTAWKIMQDDSSATQSPTTSQSKLRGDPYLRPNGSWPHCDKCNNLLCFLFQIALDKSVPIELSHGFGPHSIFQLFRCLHCSFTSARTDEYDAGWKPKLVELDTDTDTDTDTETQSITSNPTSRTGPPCTEFTYFQSLLGCRSSNWYDFMRESTAKLTLNQYETLDQQDQREDIDWCDSLTLQGNKLAGFPLRVRNGHEVPTCGECTEYMKFVMQIESENTPLLPFQSNSEGYPGYYYLYQCAQHIHNFAFIDLD